MQGAADDVLTTVCPLRELLPALVPSTLVGGEVGHHRAQSSSERTHVGGDRATTRCWTLAGSLVGKLAHREIDELRRLVLILQEILDDLLSRVEGLEVLQTHGVDGDLDDVLLGDAGGTLLLVQEILTSLDEHALRNETDNLRTRHADATLGGGTANLVEGLVERGDIDVGHVHRDLCDAILVDEPSDGLCGFQRARLHDG